MERIRKLGLDTENKISWHARDALSLRQSQIRFHELHPDPKRTEAHRQRAAELVMFDIVRNNSREKVERLEIKHLTGEK